MRYSYLRACFGKVVVCLALLAMASAAHAADAAEKASRWQKKAVEHPGQKSLGAACPEPMPAGKYRYYLRLPTSYQEEGALPHPCVFISGTWDEPGTKLKDLEKMADELGWVMVFLGDMGWKAKAPKIASAVVAAHDDVVQNVRVQEGAKVFCGFNPSADHVSHIIPQLRPGFGGLVVWDFGSKMEWSQLPGRAQPVLMAVLNNASTEAITAALKICQTDEVGRLWIYDSEKSGMSRVPATMRREALTWLHNQMLLGVRGRKMDPQLLWQALQARIEAMPRAESAFQKAERLQACLDVIKSHKLDRVTDDMRERVKALKGEIKKLKKEDSYRRDSKAQKDWQGLKQGLLRVDLHEYQLRADTGELRDADAQSLNEVRRGLLDKFLAKHAEASFASEARNLLNALPALDEESE